MRREELRLTAYNKADQILSEQLEDTNVATIFYSLLTV